ncbi:fibrous sheath CABYR-binding protein-like [Rhipicephalus sanguineus]|uniref:fibrous sheath CABYR-binding protein-like n=1 Tax=Rhipicephalus sanguineus TaxID=34632 RepID=UPI0018942D9F|nr:fibrous sheath CABYR-binding protein-like [Rhipicephalus sanguineus]
MSSSRRGSAEGAPEKSPSRHGASYSAADATPAPRPDSQPPVSGSDVAPNPAATSDASKPGEQKLVGSAVAAEPVGTSEGHRPAEENPVDSVAAAEPTGTSEGHHPVEEKPVGSVAAAKPVETSKGHHAAEEKPVGSSAAGETVGTSERHHAAEEKPVGSAVAAEPVGTSEGHPLAEEKPVGSAAVTKPTGTSEDHHPAEEKPVGSTAASEPTETTEDHKPQELKPIGSAVAAEPRETIEGYRPAEEKPVGSAVAGESVGTSERRYPAEEKPVGAAAAAEPAGTSEGHPPAEEKLVGFAAAAKPTGTSEGHHPAEEKPVGSIVASEPTETSEGHKPPEQKPAWSAVAAEPREAIEGYHPAEEKPVGSAVAGDPVRTSEGHNADAQKPEPQCSISAASQRSLELTAGLSSSLPHQQSGPLSLPKATSKSRADYVCGSSQTLEDSTGAYRSLTLQYSPRRRNQQDSWSGVTSPGGSEAPWSPMSPSSPGSRTPSVSAAGASRTWASFALPPGAADDAQTKLVHSEELFKKAASGAVTAERARSMTMQVSSGLHDQASPSPRTVTVWTGLPWRLSRPQSPSSSDKQLAAALSAEAAEFEDALAAPRLPWATLTVMWLAALAHWKFLHKHYPERCASSVAIVDEGHWSRVVFAAFHHEDFWHLTSNLVPFFFKGIVLEAALGTTYFAALFTFAVLAVGLANMAVIEIAYAYTRASYLRTMCAHTFSGVVVALQVFSFSRYSGATLHYGKYEHSAGAHWGLLLAADLEFAWPSLQRALLPVVVGLFVGLIMVAVVR